jgi:hypothetical protein
MGVVGGERSDASPTFEQWIRDLFVTPCKNRTLCKELDDVEEVETIWIECCIRGEHGSEKGGHS